MITAGIFNSFFVLFDVPHDNLSVDTTTRNDMWIGRGKLKALNVIGCFQVKLKRLDVIDGDGENGPTFG